MTTFDPPDDPDAVHQRLAEELDRLEAEQRAVNLRSEQALEECRRKIELLRRRIEALRPRRDPGPQSRRRE